MTSLAKEISRKYACVLTIGCIRIDTNSGLIKVNCISGDAFLEY